MNNFMDNAYYKIISYCIASEQYKLNFKEEFVKCLDIVNERKIIYLLNRLHILGLFYSELIKIGVFHNLIQLINPFIFYQQTLNDVLIKEMNMLGKEIDNNNIPTIILKGPSFWKEFYNDNYSRKVDDIDLMFLGPEEMEKFCNIVINLGYQNVENEKYKTKIRDNNYFGLNHFTRKEELILNEYEREKMDIFYDSIITLKLENIFRPKISKIDGKLFSLIQVEPHKSIFVYQNGEFPEITSNYYKNHIFFKSYLMLTKSANLPYLATKFIFDAKAKEPKCIKLYADFIKIILQCDKNEIKDSINISNKWGVVNLYLTMLNSIKMFVPELDFKNLSNVKLDPFHKLLSDFIEKEKLI